MLELDEFELDSLNGSNIANKSDFDIVQHIKQILAASHADRERNL